jgi:hypothetical protein
MLNRSCELPNMQCRECNSYHDLGHGPSAISDDQLLARVRELEGEIENLKGKTIRLDAHRRMIKAKDERIELLIKEWQEERTAFIISFVIFGLVVLIMSVCDSYRKQIRNNT